MDNINSESKSNMKAIINMTVDGDLDYDLNDLYIATNASGTYNSVERRMAPLSKELSGQILLFDQYGSHLDNKGMTVDEKTEKNNVQFAGDALAEVWNNIVINGHEAFKEYAPHIWSHVKHGFLYPPHHLQQTEPAEITAVQFVPGLCWTIKWLYM